MDFGKSWVDTHHLQGNTDAQKHVKHLTVSDKAQKDLDMIGMTADVLYRALTLQVTIAPTSGKSCASVSLTTEITGSYTQTAHFISLLGYREHGC